MSSYMLYLLKLTVLLSFNVKNSETASKKKFTFVEEYDKHERPPAENGTSTEVQCEVYMREVARIDEMNSAITLNLYILISWYEPRIILNNKTFFTNGKMFTLSRDQFKEFWKPDLFVANMFHLKVKKFYDDLVIMRMWSQNNKTRLNFMELAELNFKCVMDFTMYPFDVHACPIIFKSFSYLLEELSLKWSSKKMAFAPFNSTEWNKIPLYTVKMEYAEGYCERVGRTQKRACLAIIMIITRQTQYHILQTYVPSSGFVLISWISFIVTPEAVPGRMVLLVTTLLTLITMYNSVRVSTPPNTGTGLKAIEVWITTCITFVFCALMEYATVLATRIVRINKIQQNKVATIHVAEMKNTEGDKQATWKQNKMNQVIPGLMTSDDQDDASSLIKMKLSKLDKTSLFLFPITFFIFSIVYWIYYTTERDRISKQIHEEYKFEY